METQLWHQKYTEECNAFVGNVPSKIYYGSEIEVSRTTDVWSNVTGE